MAKKHKVIKRNKDKCCFKYYELTTGNIMKKKGGKNANKTGTVTFRLEGKKESNLSIVLAFV